MEIFLRRFADFLSEVSTRGRLALLGGHKHREDDCEFIQPRISNFTSIGKPDPTLPSDFCSVSSLLCTEDGNNAVSTAPPPVMVEKTIEDSRVEMKGLSIQSGSELGSIHYQRLTQGRGFLLADQQLMANIETAHVVKTCASDSIALKHFLLVAKTSCVPI